MKLAKPLAKGSKTTGRFATADEAARSKTADLMASLKKLNVKVVAAAPLIVGTAK